MFIYSSIIYVIYLNSVVFESKLITVQENMNEACFIFICYHLVLFSNLVDEYETKVMIGNSLMYSCIAMITLNICIIMCVNYGVVRQKCKVRYLKKQRDAKIAMLKKEREGRAREKKQ